MLGQEDHLAVTATGSSLSWLPSFLLQMLWLPLSAGFAPLALSTPGLPLPAVSWLSFSTLCRLSESSGTDPLGGDLVGSWQPAVGSRSRPPCSPGQQSGLPRGRSQVPSVRGTW